MVPADVKFMPLPKRIRPSVKGNPTLIAAPFLVDLVRSLNEVAAVSVNQAPVWATTRVGLGRCIRLS